jgi:hypothetical protein
MYNSGASGCRMIINKNGTTTSAEQLHVDTSSANYAQTPSKSIKYTGRAAGDVMKCQYANAASSGNVSFFESLDESYSNKGIVSI